MGWHQILVSCFMNNPNRLKMFCIVAIALLGAAVAEAQIFSPYNTMSMYDTRAVHPFGLSMLRPDIFSIAPRVILPADITPKFILPTDIYAEEVMKARIESAEAYRKSLLVKDDEVKDVKEVKEVEEEDKEVKEDRKKRDLTSVMPLTMTLMTTMHTMPMMPMGMRSIYPATSYMSHYRYY